MSSTGLYTDTPSRYTTTFQLWKPFNSSWSKAKEVLRVTLLRGMKKTRRASPITFCSTQLRKGAKLKYLIRQRTTSCTWMAMISLCLIIMRFVVLAVPFINLPTLEFKLQSSVCFFASVNHRTGPGQTTTLCVIGGFRSTLSF